jgi:hypothetical protein
MTHSSRSIVAVPLLFALACASVADAKARRVQFSGCVRPGVEHGCLIVRSGAGTYNVTAARPAPQPYTGISGSGVPGGVSHCMQGVVLTAIRWQPNRLYCPRPGAHRPRR